jgi:hypothetical protein
MRLIFFIGLTFLLTVYCDLLDDQFFLHVYKNILLPETVKLSPIILIRVYILHINAAYDALTAYRSKSIGISSNIPKRPENERIQRNKNIAIAYAMYRVAKGSYPTVVPKFESLLQSLELDLEDHSLDLTTPIGIGNFVAMKVLEERLND